MSKLQPPRRGEVARSARVVSSPKRFSRSEHYYGFALSRSRFAPVCGVSVASRLYITAIKVSTPLVDTQGERITVARVVTAVTVVYNYEKHTLCRRSTGSAECAS